MAWEIKKDEESNAPVITDDGKIVYVDTEKGEELPLDPPSMYQKILDLGKENKTHREKYNTLKSQYEVFNGIEDIGDWKKRAEEALETVQNFNDKDYLKASKVEDLKKDMRLSYEEKLKAKENKLSEIEREYLTKLNEKDGQIRNLMVSNKFASSNFFNGSDSKTTLTSDIAEAYFGKHFKVELVDGKTVLRAYYDASHTDMIYSKVNPGEPAGFNEAMGFIIDRYPGKDNILRASGGGSGGSGGSGANTSPKDELAKLREQYEAARKNGDARSLITIENRIHALRQKT